MGDPRRSYCSLDCHKAFPWAATISDRIDCSGQFNGVNSKSCTLLCSVSRVVCMLSFSFAEVSHVLALLLWLASPLAYCLQISGCTNLWQSICVCPLIIISTVLIVCGKCHLFWCSPNCPDVAISVLGPRLILSIREYHAKLVARSNEGTAMTAIHFQAGGDAWTGGDV